MRIALITLVAVIGSAIAGAVARSSSAIGGEPAPFHGMPVRGPTGLRLLVADNPPLLLDVDAASATPVRHLPTLRRGVSWVVGVGGQSAVVVAQSVWHHAQLYGVRDRSARVFDLGDGADVTPAADGRSVWIKSYTRSGCTLRRSSLQQPEIRATLRDFPCASTIASAGSLGLVVSRTRLIDPKNGRTLLRTHWGVIAATGRALVLAGPGRTLSVVNPGGRLLRRIPWPSTVGGLDAPAADPRGRYLALAFASPGALDVWVLDTKTLRLTQVPTMPALVPVKWTSLTWTGLGQLIMLSRKNGRFAVALWRPGDNHLYVKTLPLSDQRNGSSDSFAVLNN